MLLKILVAAGIFISFGTCQKGWKKGGRYWARGFPYVVSVQMVLEGTNTSVHVCGGSIIQPDMVLTAGHCVSSTSDATFAPDSPSDIVVLARIPLSNKLKFQVGIVKEIIVHSLYDPTVMTYDVAVLKLKAPFVLGLTVQPVPLVSNAPNPPWDYYKEKRCITVTWGRTLSTSPFSALQVLNVHLVNSEVCNVMLKDLEMLSKSRRMLKNELCTYNQIKDICKADTGGPLVCEGRLVGVAVHGLNCMGKNELKPRIWARIDTYKEWIESVVAEKNCMLKAAEDTPEDISSGYKSNFCTILYFYMVCNIWKLFCQLSAERLVVHLRKLLRKALL